MFESQLKYYYQLRQLFLSSFYSNILMLKLVGESTSAAWGTRGQVGTAPFAQMALWMLVHGYFSYNPFKNLMMIHIRRSNHDVLLVDNEKRLDRNLGRPYNLDMPTAHVIFMLEQDLGMNQTFLPYCLFPMTWFQCAGAVQQILNLSSPWSPEPCACWVMHA